MYLLSSATSSMFQRSRPTKAVGDGLRWCAKGYGTSFVHTPRRGMMYGVRDMMFGTYIRALGSYVHLGLGTRMVYVAPIFTFDWTQSATQDVGACLVCVTAGIQAHKKDVRLYDRTAESEYNTTQYNTTTPSVANSTPDDTSHPSGEVTLHHHETHIHKSI
ncbi:hypothetical protein BDN70DRAFT_956949 [Pholiota conissans]|uniref:Uncharacterized protein n=1 Tax=Pholiota conissans TaxID=109636 RepID=A0A9P6CQP7_9AGAR|nr:hypothetical protein BDN70DRAFT_956949 [Pholiota conissans]